MFISNAYASAAGAPQGGGTMELIFMLAIFGLIFYFMIFRPQSKRVKEHKNLMSSISKGDEVLTKWWDFRQDCKNQRRKRLRVTELKRHNSNHDQKRLYCSCIA